MYPIKIKKCFAVGNRFLRSERAPVLPTDGIFSPSDVEAIDYALEREAKEI